MVDLIGKDNKKYLLNLLGWVSWLYVSNRGSVDTCRLTNPSNA